MENKKDGLHIKTLNWESLPADKTVYLYKIIPYKYLLRWIYEEKIRFKQVAGWDDVYELFLFKQKFVKDGNAVDFSAVQRTIYGQSWSLLRDSDALWRIYSPDKLSVRISTTFNDLVALMEKNTSCLRGIEVFVGKVIYLKKNKINEKIQEYLPDIFSDNNVVDSLFVKRDSFSYEKEVRIILKKMTECDGEIVSNREIPFTDISIRPIELIKEIAFDYRLDDALFNCLKSTIQILLPGISVRRSTLGTLDVNSYNLNTK